jgi:RNA polymerase sigma-70 factor (ECF subfamily)
LKEEIVRSTAHLQIQSGQGLVARDPTTDWDWLYAHHSRVLYRRVLGIVRNPEDAEDVLQEGLLSAFTNFHRFEGRSGLSTWLTRIVINAALMQLRSRRTHEAALLDEPLKGTTVPPADWIVDSNPNPEQVCLMTELRRVLDRSIGGLNPDMQTAVSLWYMQGLSTRQAARSCGISENTLKSRLRRARLRLARSKSLLALL